MKYLVILISLISLLHSAPARSGDRVLKQSDGTSFIGQAKGDEHLNWLESSDGEILKYNANTKDYELAEIKNNTLKASGVRYRDGIKRASSLKNTKLKKEDIYKLWSQKKEANRLKMNSKY